MKKIKILLLLSLCIYVLNVAAQHSPLDFEKKILSYPTISDAVVKDVYDKAKEGLFIKWHTIRYVIQKINDMRVKTAFIDSLRRIDYWDDDMKINLLNEKLYYLINNDDTITQREVDSQYIALSLANKKLLSDNYHSNLVQYAKWNLQLGNSYYKTFFEFEKADKVFIEALSVFPYEIKDGYAYRTLMNLHESALRGRLECARGSVFKLKNIAIPPAFHSAVWHIYAAYMTELGEKVEPINNSGRIILKKD